MTFLEIIKSGAVSLSASAQTMTLIPQDNLPKTESAADVEANAAADIDKAWGHVWSTLQGCYDKTTAQNDR